LRLLSSLASIRSCVWEHFVCAEKPITISMYFSLSSAMSACCMYTVLPVPVGPQKRSLSRFSMQCFRM